MTEGPSQFPALNRMIHEPARLAILTVLASCAAADFLFLQKVTGLSKGNLSVQLTNLEQNGLVTITKEIVFKKTRTTVRLSEQGGHEVGEYWRTMDEIRARMESAQKPSSSASKTEINKPPVSSHLA